MSCSITSNAEPVISRTWRKSGPRASVSRWAIPDDGSSRSNTRGS